MKFFDNTSTGSIISRLSSDIFTIDNELPWFCHVFLEKLSSCFGYPLGIIISLPWMIIFIIIAIILIYYV